jgi:hypothetical protein
MYDFNKYDDATQVNRYEGFIDKNGYFYKVCKRGQKITDETGRIRDSHNLWAEAFLREKLNVKDFKFNPTASALLTLSRLSGPAEILIHCFGFVYYSHDPVFYKPIIKVPDPKISNYKATEEQLDTLYTIMLLNNEKDYTNNSIFFGEDEYDYCSDDKPKTYKIL